MSQFKKYMEIISEAPGAARRGLSREDAQYSPPEENLPLYGGYKEKNTSKKQEKPKPYKAPKREEESHIKESPREEYKKSKSGSSSKWVKPKKRINYKTSGTGYGADREYSPAEENLPSYGHKDTRSDYEKKLEKNKKKQDYFDSLDTPKPGSMLLNLLIEYSKSNVIDEIDGKSIKKPIADTLVDDIKEMKGFKNFLKNFLKNKKYNTDNFEALISELNEQKKNKK